MQHSNLKEKHKMIQTMKTIKAGRLRTAIVAGLSFLEATLLPFQANADSIESRTALQEGSKPAVHHLLQLGDNKAIARIENGSDKYGIKGTHDEFSYNLGLIDNDSKVNETDDEWRVRLGYDKGSWFVEPIYQRLDDKKSHPDRAELRLGRDLTDKLEVQTAFNNNDEAAAVGFYKWDSGEVGIGGNNSNDQLKANVAFSIQANPNYGVAVHSQVGEKGYNDERLRWGRGISKYKAQTWDVKDADLNELSGVSDVVFPFFLGSFDLYDPENSCGNETWDTAGDIRHKEGVRTYAAMTANVGDFSWFAQDVKPMARVYEDHTKERTGMQLGLRTSIRPEFGKFLNNGEFYVWGLSNFQDDTEPVYSVAVGAKAEF